LTSYQHDAWEANDLMLEAQEEVERGEQPREGDEAEWLVFLDEQAELERDAMYADPKFWEYMESE
jgi:hypothetical protein